MKKRLSIMTIIICLFTLFSNVIDVKAGTVNLNINGSDTVVVGNTIDLTVRASDITGFSGGLATVQGDISFDDNFLTYVKYQNASSSLSSSYGTTTKRFVSLGMGGEYISSSDNLITITFRAKQVGTTDVGINNIVVGDTKAIVHSANANVKHINIVNQSNENDNTSSSDGDKVDKNNGNKNNSNNNSSGNKTTSNYKTKSSDNDLESLTINNAKISPAFQKSITTYNVTVPNEVSKLVIDYKKSDEKATVSIVGNENLSVGNNVVKIIVTAEDGSKKTYVLNVLKTKDNSNNKLRSLKVKESNLYPKFDSDVNEYSIKLEKKVKKLTIDAIAKDKNSKVEIIDNNDLDKNNSVVLIKVTDKNGFSNYYKLKIDNSGNKKIMLFGIDILYIFIGLLILAFILLFIIFLFKRKKDDEEEKKNNDDLYDDVVTKDELIDAIEERDSKKLKMLLTQEEANKLKDAVKKAEQNKEERITKDELIAAIKSNDKEKIKKLIDKDNLDRKNIGDSYQKTEDDEIKEELIKAIEERDTYKIKMIIKQEEANRLKNEMKKSKK